MRAWPQGGLWRHPDFLRLWSAQTISQLGSQVTFLALPLAAILVLDAGTFEVALVGFFQLLPFLLLALPAGVWVDRLPRRPVLKLGLVLAVGEVGTVVGTVISGRIARRFGVGRTIVWTALLTNIGILAVPLAPTSRPKPVLMIGFLLGGLFGNIFNVNQLSLRQAITHERLQGRMNSVVRFMYWGPQPVGMVIGGALGSTVGLRLTLVVAAAGAAGSMVPLVLNPIRRLEGVPEPPEEPGLNSSVSVGHTVRDA